VNHADGTAETNTCTLRDWMNNVPVAFNGNGRVSLSTRVLDSVGASNPRLYAAEFSLSNVSSPITNMVVRWLGSAVGAHAVIFAVSGTTGPVPPLFASQPQSLLTWEGSNVQFSVSMSGTPPFHLQWQKGTNGTYANLADGGRILGSG